MAIAGAEFFEGVEFGGARIIGEEFVPGVGAERGDAGEAAFDAAEVDGAVDAGEVGDEIADGGEALWVGLDCGDEEDGGAGEWGQDGLRGGSGFVGAGCGHGWLRVLVTTAEDIVRQNGEQGKMTAKFARSNCVPRGEGRGT